MSGGVITEAELAEQMDTNKDGVISKEEAIAYGRQQATETIKYKQLFIGALIFAIVLLASIFGLVWYAIELNEKIAIKNSNDDGETSSNLLTSSDGSEYVSTITGYKTIDVESFFDDDTSESDIMVRWVRGYFDDVYIWAAISYLELYKDEKKLILYDNSGQLKFIYDNNNDYGNSSDALICEKTLNNGTVITKKWSNNGGAARRRLTYEWMPPYNI